ncbi:type I-F CRISPR-associated endonuclease Cas1 [Pectobacterium brasiliense]|uniref:type I-F CRISPR-associated endonuclease Cas1f n=1 Tax=Pectobacterium brasiliense TaxID=180957 RepID=UPI0001A4342A|nr:type I-F CRISPR-associated endonuclease Cas1f [Pectobacterium brasiliense]KGA25862.1 CRISPR-associated protein Cas1 [Pectobacterium brasiliense]KRF62316.1 type I-F CRISPR-associated endonuclease Cas1 [Pectobacterium brasiliense]MBN3188015.1 type I-F CRISPR-associated endonuclease Cas1 [Pectobacterium brasiliense]MBN3345016.1 type I-F CRISPR-associated endonuclease Cas1 [Pectobacterium brasiliense]QHG28569.1 type I-F CRISPR-associated endonuclease Cas1 [Pectobacterium brasiliense]
MDNAFSPSDLKTILHSKRANVYYLQHCRILVNGGRVEYVTEEGNQSLYWNIPIANTSVVMLGTGTSVTQAAMREFARAGVMVGFCGGGGTPLFAANEAEVAVSWLSPQSEYRPTEYLQDWVSFWFDDEKRLAAAIAFQQVRITQIRQHWLGSRLSRESRFTFKADHLQALLDRYEKGLTDCRTSNDVLVQEAMMTKALYKLAANAVSYGDFTRAKRGGGTDLANRFLDHGNYLAYGLAAVATWVLGLPHGLAVLHGKTRRGGLVFDVADLIKDALVLPQAFIAAMEGEDEQEFRQRCLTAFQQSEALDVMIGSLQDVAGKLSQVAR